MTLFTDACIRPDSRTRRLAEHLLSLTGGADETLRLSEAGLAPLNTETLALREAAGISGDFSHPVFDAARQLTRANRVVIAAPYWDLSFPAALKIWVENLCVSGLTFRYCEGQPVSLCPLKEVEVVTTCGGNIFDPAFNFGYLETVFRGFFGAKSFRTFTAEGLDILGADVEAILRKTEDEMDESVRSR